MGVEDVDRERLIAAITPHRDSAIRDSPCTCADLRPETIMEMVLAHGLDPRTRIERFLGLSRGARSKFRAAMSKCRRDARLNRMIAKTYLPGTPADGIPDRNRRLNSLFQECGVAQIVQECEEVAVAHNSALRYAWTRATLLTRFTGGEGELESMLGTLMLMSNNHPFVSTSVTRSPWFAHYDIFYTIRVTAEYRKHALPLTYTSAFAITTPETMRGFKSYRFFEGEIRIQNGTPIEQGTIDITFCARAPMAQSRIERLAAKYAPLGTVRTMSRS